MCQKVIMDRVGSTVVRGTVSVVSSDPPYKEGNVRFTTVPSKPLSIYRVETYRNRLNILQHLRVLIGTVLNLGCFF